jgi:signal transduction histidine kinase
VRALSFDDGATALDSDSILEYQTAGFRQDPMFDLLDAFMEGVLCIAHLNCHSLLEEDWSVVNVVVHEVDGRAGHLHSVLERIAHTMCAGKCRQQRGVKVDESPCERIDEDRREYAHEARGYNEVGPLGLDGVPEGRAPLVARSVGGRVHNGRLDAASLREFHSSARAIRRDQNDGTRHPARAARIDQGDHVRTGSRDEDGDSSLHGAEPTWSFRLLKIAESAAHSRRNGRNTWVRARFVGEADAKPGSPHYRLNMARTRLRNGLTSSRARLRRFGRPRPFVVDGLFALLLTVLAVAGLLTVREYAPDDARIKDPDAIGVFLAAMTTLPLAWRRRHPEQVLAAVGIATTLFFAAQYETTTGGVGVIVALYTVASLTPRRSSLISAGITAAALAFILFVAEDVTADLVVSNYLIFGTAWILGDNIRTRRAYTANLEERAEQLERDRETSSRRAAAEERERIGREMHDIVAHSVSVMVVQAGAARRVLEANANRKSATDALRQIEDTGRGALTDMRRMLGILRNPDDVADLSPQPSITRLDSLITQARDAGVSVEYEVLGNPRPLPSAMDLSAYRIVQEALTNTIKHAGPASAQVVVRYESDRIEIEVVDDGRGAARELQNGRDPGHGLVGMRERAALYGGQLQAGPRPGGGYSVTATIPLESAAT